MRYVPTHCIRENAVLAKTILGADGVILLQEGVQLKKTYLQRLISLGVAGAYVSDVLSEDLEIASVLPDELRVKVISGIKDAFMHAAKQPALKDERERAKAMMGLAENVVDGILSEDNVMLNLVDIKVYDDYTFFHCMHVAIMSVILGIGMGFSHSKLVKLAIAALMHDVGKVFIPGDIINKKGQLTPEEYDEVKKHSLSGYIYLREHYMMAEISAYGALDHHERYDGSGYPNSKKGTGISEFGRIISVADVYDALVSDRPYRKGLFAADAMEYLMGGSGVMFDPEVVAVMVRKVPLFPLGTCVLLSNGATGLVMENYEGFGQRPRLKVFLEEDKPVDPYSLDLCNDFSTLDITVVATVAM